MKTIKITEADKAAIREEFEKTLADYRLPNGEFKFSKSFAARKAAKDERITLYYTPDAYLKITALVNKFDTEVGWHGLVRKVDDKTYLIYDILVYKQEVTGATVNTDQDEYVEFLKNLTDEQAEHMFYHGHSHVNMGVFASSVDMDHRARLIQCADENGFWIFQIWNKRKEVSTVLYDLANNVLYDTDDIDMTVLFADGSDVTEFTANADKLVVKKNILPAQTKVDNKWSGSSYNTATKKSEKAEKAKDKKKYEDYDDDLIDDGTKPYGYNYGYGYGYGYNY